MSLGDSEPHDEERAHAFRDEQQPKRVPRRSISQVLAELEGVRRLRDESIRANRLREAGELSQELERLTEEYGRQKNVAVVRPPTFDSGVAVRSRVGRRDAPPVRPPL
jgi:hypothetical protein